MLVLLLLQAIVAGLLLVVVQQAAAAVRQQRRQHILSSIQTNPIHKKQDICFKERRFINRFEDCDGSTILWHPMRLPLSMRRVIPLPSPSPHIPQTSNRSVWAKSGDGCMCGGIGHNLVSSSIITICCNHFTPVFQYFSHRHG
jgi:hypothetical protein